MIILALSILAQFQTVSPGGEARYTASIIAHRNCIIGAATRLEASGESAGDIADTALLQCREERAATDAAIREWRRDSPAFAEQLIESSRASDTRRQLAIATVVEIRAGQRRLQSVPKEETVSLTGPQIQAARSAMDYISMSGFSRAGLISQLSSSAGDGYDVPDATVAVDSLNADWNENAARSARQYLEIGGFSCRGLIRQLSSDAGDKYTVSQARYGAEEAGAC